MIVGPDQRWMLAYSLVLGPVAAARRGHRSAGSLVAPAELQVGIVTAFLGAPLFIALCRRRRLAQL